VTPTAYLTIPDQAPLADYKPSLASFGPSAAPAPPSSTSPDPTATRQLPDSGSDSCKSSRTPSDPSEYAAEASSSPPHGAEARGKGSGGGGTPPQEHRAATSCGAASPGGGDVRVAEGNPPAEPPLYATGSVEGVDSAAKGGAVAVGGAESVALPPGPVKERLARYRARCQELKATNQVTQAVELRIVHSL